MTSTKTAGAKDAAPRWATAALVLADGAVFWGQGIGAAGHAVGEVCFNTSMTGYQEIITDPSYAGQIITFTFPHIGNVGANGEDIESQVEGAVGCIVREAVTRRGPTTSPTLSLRAAALAGASTASTAGAAARLAQRSAIAPTTTA